MATRPTIGGPIQCAAVMIASFCLALAALDGCTPDLIVTPSTDTHHQKGAE